MTVIEPITRTEAANHDDDRSNGTTNPTQMKVRKRDGTFEPVDMNKIVNAVSRSADGLNVDVMHVATRTISGLHDGVSTSELDMLSIATAAALTGEEPDYAWFAARLLSVYVEKEVMNQDIHSFSQSIKAGAVAGIIDPDVAEFVAENSYKLNQAIDPSRDRLFKFFGLRTVYDRYLLKDPESRDVIETPQYFFMRVACGLAKGSTRDAIELYDLLSSLQYLTGSPTLFNSGTAHSQMSSCYLLDSPEDDLMAIYDHYRDIAALSKFAGGIGVSFSRVRSTDSLIKGTNGKSNGIVPWLHTLDASVSSVNQGGKRKGAACVYLETWHADIYDFLELKDNTGNPMRRTHHLNLANWIPDEFMRRVEADGDWTLFDPKVVPHLVDLYGPKFDDAYKVAEAEGLGARTVKARDLYTRMIKTLGETGNGWMTFKDSSNLKSNQTRDDRPENVIHLSNLCTEILEVTDTNKTTAVCNLGSLNLGSFVDQTGDRARFDFDRLGQTVQTAITYLDRVIDINFYPTPQAATSNEKWRPVGLGQMGLQDVFFKLGLPFDSPAALELSTRITEHIYFNALTRSVELAKEHGPHPSFQDTKAAQGVFQWELWDGVTPTQVPMEAWEALRADMMEHGLRNSLLLAIAPTATIASIAGCYECIEPQVSNLFKRETLSGEFLQINEYLVRELQARGLWTEPVRRKIKEAEGSIQDIEDIPAELRVLFRTAWELSMKPIIDLAAGRGAFLDQAASTNLFAESPNIDSLSAMYFYAWQQGLKTTYYLRSRPRTRINKATIAADVPGTVINSKGDVYTAAEAAACSLENPESCESCS